MNWFKKHCGMAATQSWNENDQWWMCYHSTTGEYLITCILVICLQTCIFMVSKNISGTFPQLQWIHMRTVKSHFKVAPLNGESHHIKIEKSTYAPQAAKFRLYFILSMPWFCVSCVIVLLFDMCNVASVCCGFWRSSVQICQPQPGNLSEMV